jgi:hypothetical protein
MVYLLDGTVVTVSVKLNRFGSHGLIGPPWGSLNRKKQAGINPRIGHVKMRLLNRLILGDSLLLACRKDKKTG